MTKEKSKNSSIIGQEFIVTFRKSLQFNKITQYTGLKELGSRWTSTHLENNYLRFNSPLSKEEICLRLCKILNIEESDITISNTPFLWF